ncbi:superfamily II DNA/RNA helicase [Brevundimonas vesicularis]|uniref:Superfamily II DNA/RNA helicase n=1 Tax=Brevundimonas vesicularis TaxID=41276 RepID=A0A7W9FX65_BREVE|nr:SNF2-related protein [Brevundimonas vesicularis]MBB5773222.1 superfamily II DNA/RNA helicase [Brevundimonas vesicularis]
MSAAPTYTPHQAKYFAHFLTREGLDEGEGLTQSLSSARVDLNPHQVDAAMFALRSPLSKGVLLADEVGLGKTIEAALVLSQRWWERQRDLLLIVPASLRKQWATELREKFSLPSVILDAKRVKDLAKVGKPNPLGRGEGIVILSYEYAARIADQLRGIPWNLVVFDEAHKLRNVYRAIETSRAAVLRDALAGRQKLLLTATPLQNNLMELYGLVTIIDETYFGSEQAFRAEFGGREDKASQALLARRLEPICKRTLRRQVQKAGLINYTNRLPKTFDFTPDKLETDLYEHMSDYLRRDDTLAVGQNGRHLVTLVLRKILGSSSFAVAATLDKMVNRLERKLAVNEDALDDIDGVEETAEEWREDGDAREAEALEDETDDAIEDIDPEVLKAEIEELARYRDLAASIQTNAKGKALLDCLPGVLEEIVAKGGQRKAVIFTESVRTQTYLRELLERSGFESQTVVLNGSNSDKDSNAIYKAWLEKHRGTDVVSGSKTADMKAAIVDAFRNDRTILIATESGAEGINLQFCSLLINYDLPWNPQRVEQRIGRCHRYGQKIDVTVINFMNRKNQAEARIVQLLDQKFRLFEGVFGSSDEVLGAIESGVDIERRILDIVQSCRTNEEINEAFDRLQEEFSVEIDEAKTEARNKLLAEMDDKVISRLIDRKGEVAASLDEFRRALLNLARAELPEARFHDDHVERFDYDGETYSTEWPEADERGWRFFRLADEGLADQLVERAHSRELAPAQVAFDYGAYDGNLADVAGLRGRSGWMRVARLKLNTPARAFDELICAAFTDDGEPVHPETAERMLGVPGRVIGDAPEVAPEADLTAVLEQGQTEIVGRAQERLGDFLNEEEERLDNWRDDARVSYDQQIKALTKEANEKKKLARAVQNLQEKVELQREASALKRQADDLQHQLYTRLKEIDDERERMLDEIAEKLNLTPEMTTLFTIRWSLA